MALWSLKEKRQQIGEGGKEKCECLNLVLSGRLKLELMPGVHIESLGSCFLSFE